MQIIYYHHHTSGSAFSTKLVRVFANACRGHNRYRRSFGFCRNKQAISQVNSSGGKQPKLRSSPRQTRNFSRHQEKKGCRPINRVRGL